MGSFSSQQGRANYYAKKNQSAPHDNRALDGKGGRQENKAPHGAARSSSSPLESASVPSFSSIVAKKIASLTAALNRSVGGVLGSLSDTKSTERHALLDALELEVVAQPLDPLEIDLSKARVPKFDRSRESVPQRGAPRKSKPEIPPLPIDVAKQEILETVRNNPSTVIKSGTGSGKTTRVSLWLAQEGYKVIIPQPRRLPAKELAEYNASLVGTKLGKDVGFRHMLSQLVSAESSQIFTTYGFEFTRLLSRFGRKLASTKAPEKSKSDASPGLVIMVDEFHERSVFGDMTLALVRRLQKSGVKVKLVVLSATIDTESVSRYLDGAPVIDVPGRPHAITNVAPGRSPAEDAAHYASRGLVPLVMLYGKREIAKVAEQLQELGVTAEITPLHSGLSSVEQARALVSYPHGKIILATPIAETSLTIPDADVVIISGEKRRLTVDFDTPTLTLEPITQFEWHQQAGRVGRTRPGICVSYVDPSRLQKEAPPEIKQVSLESYSLRLLASGSSLEEMNKDLLTPASEAQIREARALNYRMGLCGPAGHITKRGLEAAKLPVGNRLGKMLVVARERAERLGSPDVLFAAIDIAAVCEAEGILSDQGDGWRDAINTTYNSDPLALMMLFQKALNMTAERRAELDLDEVKLNRALEHRTVLRRRLLKGSNCVRPLADRFLLPIHRQQANRGIVRMAIDQNYEPPAKLTKDQLQAVRECYWEGHLDLLFRKVGEDRYGNLLFKPALGGDQRILSKESVVWGADLIVANPLNIEYRPSEGADIKTVKVLLMADAVDTGWLAANTPSQLKNEIDEALQAVGEHAQAQKRIERRRSNKVIRYNPFRNRGRRNR